MKRKRTAESETARATARSSKRSDGTEAVKADGVGSEAETRKHEDGGVPTLAPSTRKSWLGTDFEKT